MAQPEGLGQRPDHHTGDGPLVVHAHQEPDAPGVAVGEGLHHVARVPLVDGGDVLVLPVVFLRDKGGAPGQENGHHLILLRLGVGRRGARQPEPGPAHQGGDHSQDGNGLDQVFHHAAPPFRTPKRRGAVYRSMAHTAAFISRMA